MIAGARRAAASTTADPAECAREIALRLLNHAPRSAARLRDDLVARDVDPVLAADLVERYREVGLVDDVALAAMITRTRHRERGQARRAISQELRRKGFEPDAIASALGEIDDESESDVAAALAQKRWRQLSGVPAEARIRRVVGMLARKGHSPSLAFSLVKRLAAADRLDDGGLEPD